MSQFNSNIYINNRQADNQGLRESAYNESRENIYNKQKDLHKDIEIDVPELVQGDNDYQVEEASDRESTNELNNKSNVSANILQEYKMGQIYGSQRKAMTNSKMKSDYPSTTNISRNDQRSSRSVERRIEELYKWQDRINKKHDVQREFQEQIKESMHDQKIYTNDLSNQIMEIKRPNTSVENILLMQGKVRELKIKKLEHELYGKERVPNITKKGQNISRDQKVHTRLYDLDKSRRDKSKEALSASRNQSRSIDLQRSKSKDSIKRKSLYSLLKTSKQPSNNDPNNQNMDYFKDMFSPINKAGYNSGRDFALSPQAILASSSLTSFGSPVYSGRHAEQHFFPRNFSMHDETISPRTQLAIAQSKRGLSQSKGSPISIYKKLTSFNATPANKQLAQNNEPKLTKSELNLDQKQASQEPSSHRYQSPEQPRRGLANGGRESVPVLPNMLFFKSAERPVSVASTNNINIRDYNSTTKEKTNKLFESAYQPFDMRSMEAFWEQILQDDVQSRGRKPDDRHLYHSQYTSNEDYQSKFDITERNKLWLDKKNKKIDDQRRLKEQQELKACTFKPHLYAQEKNSQKQNNQQLYQNFLHRVVQSSKDPKNTRSSGSNDSPSNLGVPRSVKHSQEDIDLQKKLYDYILEAKYQ